MFLTTAISYLNGEPHLGHLLEIVISDIISRYYKTKDETSTLIFQTGSDEHGQKISDKAVSVGLTPIELCNQNLEKFQNLYKVLKVNEDIFVRTTSKNHHATVQHVFQLLKSKDDIYLDNYTGWYNCREEKYVTEGTAKLLDYKDEVTGKPLEKIEEPSYFFRLSKYQDRIIEFYKNNPDFISDKSNYTIIMNRLNEPLQDLSISRVNIKWGIPLDEKHVCYVWFDALLNYLSGIDYFEIDNENTYPIKGKDIWKDVYHLIGKDIVWFHGVIWPAMLMALDIKLPKQLIVHGFVTDEKGIKMSKSVGNVINPFDLLKTFPADTLRSYVIRFSNLEFDAKCGISSIVNFHNGELANNIGNMFNRLIKQIDVNYDSIVPVVELNESNQKLLSLLDVSFVDELDKMYQKYQLKNVMELSLKLFQELNLWFTEQAPWSIKDNDNKKKLILRIAFERVYQLTHILYPIIPDIALSMSKIMNKPLILMEQLKKYHYCLNDGIDNLKLSDERHILFPKVIIETDKQKKNEKQKKDKKNKRQIK
jgi:methionyl-tRNA synthetase